MSSIAEPIEVKTTLAPSLCAAPARTSPSCETAGVMRRQYALDRRRRAPLIHRYRLRAALLASMVRRYVGPGPVRLLDVGCADGLALIETARLLGPGRFVGVEYATDILAMAPKHLPETVTLVPGNAMALAAEFLDGGFHVACALALLEHLPDPLRAMRQLYDSLRPGGLFFATCPNPFWDRISAKLGTHIDEHHVQRIDCHRLSSLTTQAGFRPLRAGRFMWSPLAVLPYAGLKPPTQLSLCIDAVVDRIPFLRRLCVNAYVVGRKP